VCVCVCVCVQAIHSIVYSTNGTDKLVHICNHISDDVNLEVSLILHFKQEGLTYEFLDHEKRIFFCSCKVVIGYIKQNIVIVIEYNFKPACYIWSQPRPNECFINLQHSYIYL